MSSRGAAGAGAEDAAAAAAASRLHLDDGRAGALSGTAHGLRIGVQGLAFVHRATHDLGPTFRRALSFSNSSLSSVESSLGMTTLTRAYKSPLPLPPRRDMPRPPR